ncbi:MAG: hypothetical protein PHY29_02405 [Syntrophales bacterium]|nr:hypothetical protein [Syntrophales bacterium]
MKVFPVHTICFQKWLLFLGVVASVCLAAVTAGSETGVTKSVSKLSASIEKTTARVGDRLWLDLTYELPEGTRLSGDATVKGLETLTVIEQIPQPGKIKILFLVDQLESFKLGPFSLTCIDDKGDEHKIETDPIAITILSNLGKKPEEAILRPIQDIMPVKSRWIFYLSAAFAVIALFGVVSGLIWWRRKQHIGNAKAIMEDPPHVRAEKEIATLLASGLFEKGDVKAFYFSFSETIRRYMEAIRHFPAAEMTTEEILRHIGANSHDQEVIPLLRQTDLVKFADATPTTNHKERDVRTARDYIRQTSPVPDKAPGVPPGMEVGG